MHKNKKRSFNVKLLKNFFAVKLNVWIIVASLALFLCVYFYYSSFPERTIFPAKDFAFEFYTDSASGGNSTILYHNISDSAIVLDFELRDGFSSPYVGINIIHSYDSMLNLTPYNRLYLEVAGEQIRSIGFSLYARNAYRNTAAGEKEVCFYENIDINGKRQRYSIDLDKLKVPDWWYGQNNVPVDEELKPDLQYTSRINIGPAYGSASNIKRSLVLYKIVAERNNTRLIQLLFFAECVLFFLLGIAHYIQAYKAQPVTITYKAVDIENEQRQLNSFLDYINSNFYNPHLTLEQVSRQTGINQRRIAASIQESFGCNFKTYLNRLRINESKRLLMESELNRGEIAFKVGFNNQSHFNRVFKSLEGISPSEFIESARR